MQTVQDGLAKLASSPQGDDDEPKVEASDPSPIEATVAAFSRPEARLCADSPIRPPATSSFETMLRMSQSSLAEKGITANATENVVCTTPVIESSNTDSAAAVLEAGHSILAIDQATMSALLDTITSDALIIYPCVNILAVRNALE